jgi:hypothetical protein
MPVNNLIQLRRGTATQWTTANPTLSVGEIGFETNTGKFKVGNGSANWAALAYAASQPGHSHSINDITDYTPPVIPPSTIISATVPVSPQAGAIWFDSNEGRSYIYYDNTFVDLTPSIKGADGANGVDGQNAFHPFLIG